MTERITPDEEDEPSPPANKESPERSLLSAAAYPQDIQVPQNKAPASESASSVDHTSSSHEEQQQQQQQQQQPQHYDNDEASPSYDKPFRILTVGDGDLTLSRALLRAYANVDTTMMDDNTTERSNPCHVTATTLLPSAATLREHYPHTAPAVLTELQEQYSQSCEIHYGVDATQLHQRYPRHNSNQQAPDSSNHRDTKSTSFCFDAILFHHPHLGGTNVQEDEQRQVVQHQRLMAHYLWSAAQCLPGRRSSRIDSTTDRTTDNTCVPTTGILHLCLCGNQAQTWRLHATCRRLGLDLVAQESTAQPFHQAVLQYATDGTDGRQQQQVLDEEEQPRDQQQHSWICHPPPATEASLGRQRRRRQVNSKHYNHRHWLVPYGYGHQRTHGELAKRSNAHVNLEGSQHYIIRPAKNTAATMPMITASSGITARSVPSTLWSCIEDTASSNKLFRCDICLATYPSLQQLEEHLHQPAVPASPPQEEHKERTNGKSPETKSTASMDLGRKDTTTTTITTTTTSKQRPQPQQLRLRRYLQTKFGKSKNQANRLIGQGFVTMDGVVVKDTARLVSEECIVAITAPLSSSPEQQQPPTGNATANSADQGLEKTTLEGDATSIRLGGLKVEELAEWTLPSPSDEHQQKQAANDIVMIAVWKPVGLRTLGHFSVTSKKVVQHRDNEAAPKTTSAAAGPSSTLESIVSQQQQQQRDNGTLFYSWTRLDTGCSGVCLLSNLQPPAKSEGQFELEHHFTFLVHGHVPDDWKNGKIIQLPLENIQRWKKRQRPASEGSKNDKDQSKRIATEKQEDDTSEGQATFQIDNHAPGTTVADEPCDSIENIAGSNTPKQDMCSPGPFLTARVVLLEKTSDASVPLLSTLRLETADGTVSGIASLICYCFRTDYDYRVVGDRFSRKEDSQRLPRSMRNRIKQKLCLACTHVRISSKHKESANKNQQTEWRRDYTHGIPDKWRAHFWQDFLQHGRTE